LETTSRTDPRIRRTRRALIDALLALAEEQDFTAITISDIARRADVNRKTFYLHYADKEALLAEAFDTLFANLVSASRVSMAEHGPPHPEVPPPSAVALFASLAEHRALYRRLIGVSGSTRFAVRLRTFLREQFFDDWDNVHPMVSPDSPPPDFRADFTASATEGIAIWWLKEPRDQSPDVVATWLWRLIRPMWFEIGINDAPAQLRD